MHNKERIFLDEARVNRKKFNSNAQLNLLEAEGGISYIERCKRDKDLPLYLVGIAQSGDKPNRNGRIYPWQYLKKECIRYMDEVVKPGLSYLQLDHPADETTPMLDDAAGTIEDIWFDENKKNVWVKVKVLNAFMPENAPGLKVRGFLLNGKNVGISSRALGSVEENYDGYDVVQDDYELICWDFVANASNFGSETLDLQESKMLTESQCYGDNCSIKPNRRGLTMLTESEKKYLDILGVEKFLQIKSQQKF